MMMDMTLTVLGSAAAEAIPDPFCACRVCQTARREGGAEVRMRATALINDDLLIDLGPDLLASTNRLALYLGNLETILITHRHEDHWLPQNLSWRTSGFTPTPIKSATVCGPADALSVLAQFSLEELAAAHLGYRIVSAGDRWAAGNYQITAIPATHGQGRLEPLLYVIEGQGRRVFYATDTAPLQEAAWDLLRELGAMDLILLDATSGERSGGDSHHGMAQFLETRRRFIEEGVLVPDHTTLLAHHFSHNGGMTHTELVEAYGRYDVGIAYDGLVV
jgi:phosphoribosyl 1,2-cyclic phosphate phosphodiesterase